MKYPIRPPAHIKQAESWKLFQCKAPKDWIIREVTERDYGIDAYVEFAAPSGDVTGDLCLMQIKSTESIRWREGAPNARKATIPRIKIATVNYWMNFPCPVFLIYADLKAQRAFFACVKSQVRQQYSNYGKEKPVHFTVYVPLELGTTLGATVFKALYQKEKQFEEYRMSLYTLMLHWEEYLEFIRDFQCRDDFLEIEPDEQSKLIHVYRACRIAARHLDVQWTVPDIGEVYKQDMAKWRTPNPVLHQNSMAKIVAPLETVFGGIMRSAKTMMKVSQFWKATEPALALSWHYIKLDTLGKN